MNTKINNMTDFIADTNLSCKSHTWDVFLKKSMELLSLYSIVKKPYLDDIDVIVYTKTSLDNTYILGHNVITRNVDMFLCRRK